MKSIMMAFALLCPLMLVPVSIAAVPSTRIAKPVTGRVATRPVRPPRSSVPHSAGRRPYYGGGHHTVAHGGNYPGATNAHHKNGHYSNWRTANRYGVHQ